MGPQDPPEPFWYDIKVRFGDTDSAGVVYYATFMHYFQVALEEFMQTAVGVPYPKLVEEDRIGLATVRVESDFTGPVRYGQEVSIRVWISRIGGASVAFEFEARTAGEVCARATLTRVTLDLESWKPMVIPGELRKSLERYLDPAE